MTLQKLYQYYTLKEQGVPISQIAKIIGDKHRKNTYRAVKRAYRIFEDPYYLEKVCQLKQ